MGAQIRRGIAVNPSRGLNPIRSIAERVLHGYSGKAISLVILYVKPLSLSDIPYDLPGGKPLAVHEEEHPEHLGGKPHSQCNRAY
jgi:hypothetical protein